LEFFKLDSNWEKLQNMTAQAEEEFYWLIAGKYYILPVDNMFVSKKFVSNKYRYII
jgi:hypothetical protein